MDNKKFKKQIRLFVPVTDKDNSLILEPGTKGFVTITDRTGIKVGVNIEDLKEGLHQIMMLASLYTEEKEAEPFVEGAIIEGDEE